MNRVLVIDPDRAATQALGLACLDRDLGVVIADNVCEGVRVLLGTPVDLIVVDSAEMRLTAREMVTLFDRVAPRVPVVVAIARLFSCEIDVMPELALTAVRTSVM